MVFSLSDFLIIYFGRKDKGKIGTHGDCWRWCIMAGEIFKTANEKARLKTPCLLRYEDVVIN